MNSPVSGSMLEPVILLTPVRDTVTFPVFASPHENVSFARREILPPLPLVNVPLSSSASMDHGSGGIDDLTMVMRIEVRVQFHAFVLSQIA